MLRAAASKALALISRAWSRPVVLTAFCAACTSGGGHASSSVGGASSNATCKSGDPCTTAGAACTNGAGVTCDCVGPENARYVTCDTASSGGAGGAGGGAGGREGAGGTFVMPANGGVSGYGQDTGKPCADVAPYSSSNQPDTQLVVDVAQTQGAWNRFYERAVAADHANTVLSSAYGRNIQNAMKKGHDQAGFQYVRFHGILDYDIDVYTEDAGVSNVDFGLFDEVYDAILTAGMRPLFEVSFTPPDLATSRAPGNWLHWYNWHKANISPPKDWTRWESLMTTIVQHLESRYGVDEVRKNWYFEVWNEASWMYLGDYGTLYQHTAQGLAAGDPNVRIGGPAESSAGSLSAINNLIAVASTKNVKLDFLTYHCYSSDGANDGSTIADPKYSNDFHSKMVDTVNTAGFKGELMATEWGPNSSAGADRDSEVAASFIAKTVHIIGTANVPPPTAYAYWTISDIYEEIDTGTNTAFREGNYGLLLKGDPDVPASFDVAKPAFNAFRLLHWMGDTRIALTGGTTEDGVNGAATVSADNQTVQILVYNHTAGGKADSSQSKLVSLTVNNLSSAGPYEVRHYVLDQSHSNSYTAWVQMGKPPRPTADQWGTISDAANLCYYETSATPAGNTITLTFPQKTYSVSLITLRPE